MVGEDEHAGLQVECPTCQRLLTIPKPDDPPKREAAPLPPPKKKLAMRAEDEDEYLDEDGRERRPRKRKKRFRDENPVARRMMERAHAELDEEEVRRRSGGGLSINPGIIQGAISVSLGFLLLVVMYFVGCCPIYGLVVACFLIVGGIVRIILGFTGQGTD